MMAGWRIWSQRLLLGAMMLFPSLAAAAPFVTQRPPGPDDNTAAGYRPGDFWVYGKQVYVDDANGIWRRVVLTSEYPVDSVGGKIPAACYGTRKLRAGYRGPLIQVVNPQTRVATRIFADPGGALDQKALVTAMGDTKFLQVSVLYDQCGHNNATQPNPANRPDIAPAVTMGSGIGIALDGSTMEGIAKNIVLPKTLAWPAGTETSQIAVVDFRAWYEENSGISVLYNATGRRRASTCWGYAGTSTFYVTITGSDLAALHVLNTKLSPRALNTPFVAGYVSSHDGTRLWMDGFNASTAAHSTPAVAGGMIGGSSFLKSFGYIDLADLLIYDRPLSPAEQARASAASYLAFGLSPQIRDTIDIAGDSIAEGYRSQLNLSWPRQMMKLLKRPYVMSNASFSGMGALTFLPLMTKTYFERGFLNGDARRIVFLDLGSNDLAAQAKAPAIYRALCAIVANAHKAGAEVIIATVLPRDGFRIFGTTPGDDERQRLKLNAMIRAGRAGADAVVDFAADPVMGNYKTVADRLYYYDGIHPTTYGYSFLAADAAKVLNHFGGG